MTLAAFGYEYALVWNEVVRTVWNFIISERHVDNGFIFFHEF